MMKNGLAAVTASLSFATLAAIASCSYAQAQQGWEVTGTVTADTRPVGGLNISLAGPESPRTRTDGQGHYSLKGRTEGRYLLQVEKRDDMSLAPPRDLHLTNGLRVVAAFRMSKGAVVTGRVFDENKQPVSGAVVRAMSKSVQDGRVRLSVSGRARTNDMGEYRIPYLSDGDYIIVVTPMPLPIRRRSAQVTPPPGHGYPMTFYPGARDVEGATSVRLRSGDERDAIDVMVRKETTHCLSFTLGSSPVQPLVYLEERLRSETPALAEGPLPSAGSYEICGLAPGEYRLHITSLAKGPYLQVQSYVMAVATVDKRHVDLGALQLLPPTELRGAVTVKDAKGGDPLPAGLRVRLTPHEVTFPLLVLMGPGTVETGGSFVMPNVYAGNYGFRLEGLPTGYYLIGASQHGRDVLESGLRPGDGEVLITLGNDGATVHGRVLAADDAVIPDAAILLVPKEHGEPILVRSAQDGTYQLQSGVQPGAYRLVAAQDLSEWERSDPQTVARLASKGKELTLAPREARAIDLRIPTAR